MWITSLSVLPVIAITLWVARYIAEEHAILYRKKEKIDKWEWTLFRVFCIVACAIAGEFIIVIVWYEWSVWRVLLRTFAMACGLFPLVFEPLFLQKVGLPMYLGTTSFFDNLWRKLFGKRALFVSRVIYILIALLILPTLFWPWHAPQ